MQGAQRGSCGRGERRRSELLDAAQGLFLENGYSGCSVDAIVERAGGSKETVYAHFGNKAGLLRAIIERAGEKLSQRLSNYSPELSFEMFLRGLAGSYLDLILSPECLSLYRLVIAESGRMPEIGDIFYRTCPETFLRQLAQYFAEAAARGQITSHDPQHLASVFYGMLRGELQMRALFNPTRAPTQREIQAHIDYVVQSILTLCQPKDASARAA